MAYTRKDGRSKLTPVAKWLYHLKVARFWHDGDGTSFLWNLWNPLAWLLIVVIFVGTLLWSIGEALKEFPGLALTKYWQKHKDEREFF